MEVCNVTSDEDESFVSFTDSQGNNTIVKDEIDLVEDDSAEQIIEESVVMVDPITIKENDSDDIHETVELLSPSNINDRTFDQVELESKESDDLSSPDNVEERKFRRSDTVEVHDETFGSAAEPVDLGIESDDVEMVSVMGLEAAGEDFSSTKPVEDELDGDGALEKTQDDIRVAPRALSEEPANPFSNSPIVLPIGSMVNEAASYDSPKTPHAAVNDNNSPIFTEKFENSLGFDFKEPAAPRSSKGEAKNFYNIDEREFVKCKRISQLRIFLLPSFST